MSRLNFTPFRGAIADFNLSPTLGSETSKVRPCIVVTNDVYDSRLPVIQVVPVTQWSQKKSRIITNVTIAPNKANGLSK
ncbi:MAG: type II toxin-antitoxin system PemK/MazF family toxin [Cyanobacteria bacterium P01_G01_bin.19]